MMRYTNPPLFYFTFTNSSRHKAYKFGCYVGVAEQFGKSGTVTNRARTWEETNLMPSRQDTSPYLLDRQKEFPMITKQNMST